MATKTTTQFDLNSFIKGQMEKDFREVNDTEIDSVKGAIKKVLTNTGKSIIQGAILASNIGKVANNMLLEEVWDSQENLYKRMLERTSAKGE
jgi:hypothetical protein